MKTKIYLGTYGWATRTGRTPRPLSRRGTAFGVGVTESSATVLRQSTEDVEAASDIVLRS